MYVYVACIYIYVGGQVHNVLSRPGDDWMGHSGRVDIELATALIPPSTTSTFVCVCGPKVTT